MTCLVFLAILHPNKKGEGCSMSVMMKVIRGAAFVVALVWTLFNVRVVDYYMVYGSAIVHHSYPLDTVTLATRIILLITLTFVILLSFWVGCWCANKPCKGKE